MKRRVLITVAVERDPGGPWFNTQSRWTTLVLDDEDPNFDRIVGDTAQLMGQRALLGHLRPTTTKEGGRG